MTDFVTPEIKERQVTVTKIEYSLTCSICRKVFRDDSTKHLLSNYLRHYSIRHMRMKTTGTMTTSTVSGAETP